MKCNVWKNTGFCQWDSSPEIKEISEEEFKGTFFSEEETSDRIVPIKEEPVSV